MASNYLRLVFLLFINFVSSQENFELSIIHVNDIHARYEPVSVSTGTCTPEQNEQGICYGGIARIVTAVNELKATLPNPVILNGGDVYQGTMLYSLFKWNISVEFMNRIPFDATALGNHEFDDGVAGFVPYLEKLNNPIIAVNMDATNEPDVEGKYLPSVTIYRGDRKIGIIGSITPTTVESSSPGNLIFYDEKTYVTEEVVRLKENDTDIIILVSHSGYDVDQTLATEIPDLDIIVGAHSHTFLYTGTPPSIEVPLGEYPTIITQSSGKKVAVVQAYAYTKYLGAITFEFDQTGQLISWTGSPKILDSTVEEDLETKLALQPYVDEANEYNRYLGETYVLLDKSTCYDAECNQGSFLTDGMVFEQTSYMGNENAWTSAAIAIMNPGGIRAPIGENQNITFNDLVTSQPFNNTIDTIELQGKDLVEVLELAAAPKSARYRRAISDLDCLQVSGILLTYNMSQPSMSRIVDIKLRCANCREPEYRAVDSEEWYNVAMPSFLSNGGDGYNIIPQRGRNKKIGDIDVNVFSRYVEKESPIMQEVEGRITVLS